MWSNDQKEDKNQEKKIRTQRLVEQKLYQKEEEGTKNLQEMKKKKN